MANYIKAFTMAVENILMKLETVEAIKGSCEKAHEVSELFQKRNSKLSINKAPWELAGIPRCFNSDKLGWEQLPGQLERDEIISIDFAPCFNLVDGKIVGYQEAQKANDELTVAIINYVLRVGVYFEGIHYDYLCTSAGKAKKGEAYFAREGVVGFGKNQIAPLFTAEELAKIGDKASAARLATQTISLGFTSACPISEVIGQKVTIDDVQMVSDAHQTTQVVFDEAICTGVEHGQIQAKVVKNVVREFFAFDGQSHINSDIVDTRLCLQFRPLKSLGVPVSYRAWEELMSVEIPELKNVDGEMFSVHETAVVCNESTCKLIKFTRALDKEHPWAVLKACFKRAGWDELYVHAESRF